MGDESTRDRLRHVLGEAVRARDKVAASALRSALAALDHAGAVLADPLPTVGPGC